MDTPPRRLHPRRLRARHLRLHLRLDLPATARALRDAHPGSSVLWLDASAAVPEPAVPEASDPAAPEPAVPGPTGSETTGPVRSRDAARTSSPGWRATVLATDAGPHARVLTHDAATRTTTLTEHGATRRITDTDLLPLLRDLSSHTHLLGMPSGLPFRGGFLGYLGHEMKTATLAPGPHRAPTPDAWFVEPQTFLVHDPRTDTVDLVSLGLDTPIADRECAAALARFRAALVAAPSAAVSFAVEAPESDSGPSATGNWRLDDAAYEDAVRTAHAHLVDGDSYEVCLTDTFETAAARSTPGSAPDGLDLYTRLRTRNPADHAAYLLLRHPDAEPTVREVEILSASPERFLRVEDDGRAESRPIKGTTARRAEPAADAAAALALRTDAKTRAENLMIVDLVRNDLSRVCTPGSVAVPDLMTIRSLPRVHQMVSTVTGRLETGRDGFDAIHACFPPGSMTGAPKQRTVEIIDALETGPRGVYSGALGALGYDGTVDLSVVIRTLVRHDDTWTLGAGGAIVLDSTARAEREEKDLKASVLLDLLRSHLRQHER
ncbi:anthranilate synthase component I family protein [Brevibacterium litoralis]|uniref:anthranilate synthase component I family protein n=1 Tax=Brevibacterium litoralis TaxID=3138935 RepID=UPI0032ECB47D